MAANSVASDAVFECMFKERLRECKTMNIAAVESKAYNRLLNDETPVLFDGNVVQLIPREETAKMIRVLTASLKHKVTQTRIAHIMKFRKMRSEMPTKQF